MGFVLIAGTVATSVWAQEDRAADCVNLVNRCVGVFGEKGPEYTLKAIDSKSVFIDKELYIFALNMNNVMLAHPHKPDWRGRDVNSMTDANNKEYFKEFKGVAEKGGSGWVEYYWVRPGEDKPRQKWSYIARVPGRDIYIGAGYYPTTEAKSPPPNVTAMTSGTGKK